MHEDEQSISKTEIAINNLQIFTLNNVGGYRTRALPHETAGNPERAAPSGNERTAGPAPTRVSNTHSAESIVREHHLPLRCPCDNNISLLSVLTVSVECVQNVPFCSIFNVSGQDGMFNVLTNYGISVDVSSGISFIHSNGVYALKGPMN